MEAQRTPLVEEGAEESRQPRVLVAYGSRYGFSQRCAKDLANELTAETDLMDVGKRRDLIWGRYSAVLIGGPIYGGKPLRTLTQFCERNREWLLGLPVGVFICCLSQGEHAAELLGSAFPPWLSAHAFSREILGGEFQSQKLTVLDKILIGNLSGLNVALSFVNERAIKGIAAAVDALD